MRNIHVALENIRSIYNVGAILRTCSFFGINNVILVGYSGKRKLPGGKVVLHEKVAKAALGAEKELTIEFLENAQDLFEFAETKKIQLIAVEQTPKSIALNKWHPQDNCVLVFGNEVSGVSSKILTTADKILEISRAGKHNSLNVATCCGIVLHYLNTLMY